jgi:hypothetical protein
VGIVYGRPVHFYGEPPLRHRDRATQWRIIPGGEWLELRCRRGVNCITSPEVLMRRSVVDLVGGQRPLAHTHDMEMWMRIARASDVGIVYGADQAFHREHSDSLSAREVDVAVDLSERLEAYQTLFTDGLGDAAEDARRLGQATKALGREALARTTAAYVRGRGGSAETSAYIDFARRCGALDELPGSGIARDAIQRGARAGHSPALIAWAAMNRLRADVARYRWHLTSL